MNILEAYDLTGSLRDAAELAGCSHHTVARYVAGRERGRAPGAPARRPGVIDPFLPKLEELVDRSRGKIRADVAHDKITAMGYAGSERTTRRAVAGLKAAWHAGRRRVHRPWVPEPGMQSRVRLRRRPGDRVGGDGAVLLLAGMVAVPGDRPAAGQDLAERGRRDRRGAAPGGRGADVPADRQREDGTVTVEHVAGLPVRNAAAVELGRHDGLTIATCVPYDPASKGGSESTVKLAKADLVPAEANLRPAYASFAELETACLEFCEQVNARPHRVTRRVPAEMLGEERDRLHPVPEAPFTLALGVTRTVDAMSLVAFEGGQYSVPHQLAGQVVWVRRHGGQVVITRAGTAGVAEVARHLVTTPGSPRVDDAHYPPAPPGALARVPKARTRAEAEFLAIGDGARLWLAEAAAAGATRVRAKMAQAAQLAVLHGAAATDRALGQAAAAGRFADRDLALILAHEAAAGGGEPCRAGEQATLAQGTAAWARHGGQEASR